MYADPAVTWISCRNPMCGIPHAVSFLTSVVATRTCFFGGSFLYFLGWFRSNAGVFRFHGTANCSGVLLCVLGCRVLWVVYWEKYIQLMCRTVLVEGFYILECRVLFPMYTVCRRQTTQLWLGSHRLSIVSLRSCSKICMTLIRVACCYVQWGDKIWVKTEELEMRDVGEVLLYCD